MSYVCEICGKSTVTGRSKSHKRGVAGKRWKKRAQVTPRTFKPNLQKVSVMLGGVKTSAKLCTKCLKKLKSKKKLPESSKRSFGISP